MSALPQYQDNFFNTSTIPTVIPKSVPQPRADKPQALRRKCRKCREVLYSKVVGVGQLHQEDCLVAEVYCLNGCPVELTPAETKHSNKLTDVKYFE